MDEMKISTGFMQKLIANIIKKTVKKKTGYAPDLQFNDPIRVIFDEEKFKLHVNLDVELSKEELSILLANLL